MDPGVIRTKMTFTGEVKTSQYRLQEQFSEAGNHYGKS